MMAKKLIYWIGLILCTCLLTYYNTYLGLIFIIAVPLVAIDIISKSGNKEKSRKPSKEEKEKILEISSDLTEFENFRVSSSIKGGIYSPGVFTNDIIIISESLFDDQPEVLKHVIAHEIGHSKKYPKIAIIVTSFFPLVCVFLISLFSHDFLDSFYISIILTPFIVILDAYMSRKIEMMANKYCWDNDMEDFEHMVLSARRENSDIWVKKLFQYSPTKSDILVHYLEYKENEEVGEGT